MSQKVDVEYENTGSVFTTQNKFQKGNSNWGKYFSGIYHSATDRFRTVRMVNLAEEIFPEYKREFEKINLPIKTTVCRVEEMNSDLLKYFSDTLQKFAYIYSV
jgi:hypothetical protein